MPGQITVDTENELARVFFIDDRGNQDAEAPEGTVVTFASSNPAVASVAPAEGDGFAARVTPMGEGAATISADITDAYGNPILEPDGLTPFTVPPVTVHVGPGEAATAGLALSI